MKIIIHCSDSQSGNASQIAQWHTLPKPRGNGWNDIGYHYIILNGKLAPGIHNNYFDGLLETGRPLDDDNLLSANEFGAHAVSQNDKSVGVCLIGKSGQFTLLQIERLKLLLKQLKIQFGTIEIFQHSDFEPKKPYCAGLPDNLMQELRGI